MATIKQEKAVKRISLNKFIKHQLAAGVRKFNIPLDEKGYYNTKGLSRVRFKVKKNYANNKAKRSG